MTKTFFAALSAAAALALAPAAQAIPIVDTGTPTGAGFPLSFDPEDWYAAQFSVSQASTIDAVAGFISGGTSGETFDISLFDDDGSSDLGSLVATTTATFGKDGWNGVSGLSGWNVQAGTYWVEFEIQGADTLDSSLSDAATLAVGAPNPVATTAFTSDGGSPFGYTLTPMSFGLEIDATAVPEPASVLQLAAGALLLASLAVARRRRG